MMKKYWLLLPFCAAVSAEPQPLPPVIDNSTYLNGAPNKSAGASFNNAMYELLGRMEQLEHEVQQLRGVVEEQAMAVEELKSRQSNIYSDLDKRLQTLSEERQQNESSFSESSSGNSASQNVSDASQKAKQSLTVSEKQLYEEAHDTLRNGHYSQAIAALKTLIAQYPSGEYADNAQYWLGEAYKVNQNTDAARSAFKNVLKLYPNSSKVPDALLKLGYIEFEQKNFAKARDYLTQVTVNYPGTTAAHLAEKKLMRIDQQ